MSKPPHGAKLPEAQAQLQAKRTGKAVTIASATTPTSTTQANPDGTFTLRESAVPVRRRVGTSWQSLDATLRRSSSGSITTTATTQPLTLSSGGTEPLATMTNSGRVLSVSAPMRLPAPTLSGATATYEAVLPGVDLVVTADDQGGFSSVLVVHDALAAKSSALRSLAFATKASGVSLKADAAGNLAATDVFGHAVFTAPAPQMWDSTATAPGTTTTRDKVSGEVLVAKTGQPVLSSVNGPGAAAHTARVETTVRAGVITLRPDTSLLSSTATAWPAYIDPSWSSTGSGNTGWATIAEQFPDDNWWDKTPGGDTYMQAGSAGGITSRSMINFPISPSLAGATVHSAEVDVYEHYAYSCQAEPVDLYAPSTTLKSSNATWDDWKNVSLGSTVASVNDALGWTGGTCSPPQPADWIGFDVTAPVTSDAASGKTTQTFMLKARSETDSLYWKKFATAGSLAPTIEILYNHKPNTPGPLSTSPQTACTSPTAAVGDDALTLYAPVSDPDQGNLSVYFQMWKTADTTKTQVWPKTTDPIRYPSGSTASGYVPEATLKTLSGGVTTQFSWHVQVSDGFTSSSWSTTCTFSFNPTAPGAPIVSNPGDWTTTIGQPTTIEIDPPSGATLPFNYVYQPNGGAPETVTGSTSPVDVTLTPNRTTNILTVVAINSVNNAGETAEVIFNSTAASMAVDGDMNGDNSPDLVSVGGAGTNIAASGLWLAAGTGNGQIATNATDLGAYGSGLTSAYSPSDFDGGQAITGHFTGTGLQDVLVYYPSSSSVEVLRGNGDGSALQPEQNLTEYSPTSGSMTDLNGFSPSQLVNAGGSSGLGGPIPELIGVSGTTVGGVDQHYLDYYFGGQTPGSYQGFTPDGVAALSTQTPAGDMAWDQWTLATTQLPSGTAMYLWNKSTGALDLWENIAVTLDGVGGGTMTYTPYVVKTSGWNTGTASAISLAAGDVNGDGVPDLWGVAKGGAVTQYIVTGLTTTGSTITAAPTQTLITAQHSWPLSDIGGASATAVVGTTADNAGGNNASSATATWNTGDLFSPDVALNGTSGVLTAAKSVTTNASFSVSAWVKPNASGGVVLSQDAGSTAGFSFWAEPSDSSWRVAIPSADSASPTWYVAAAAANTVQKGVWTQLLASYNQTTGALKLYVNGVYAATVTHTATVNAAGSFQIGDVRSSTTAHGSYFNGQVSQVQAWTQAVDPTQGMTPGGDHEPVNQARALDTRSGVGEPAAKQIAAGGTLKLQIAGVAGVPATNVVGAVVTVTVLNQTSTGYLTVYPDDTPPPATSNVNYNSSGATISNLVIVPVGNDGKMDLTNHGSSIDALVDITGYFTSDPTAAGLATYTPVATPVRILDTRSGLGAPTAPVASGGTLALLVGGVGGVPSAATAVVLNLTATGEAAAGRLVTFADAVPKPGTSGLQYQAAASIAGLAVVPVGSDKKIDIYSSASTDVVADVVGYFTAGVSGQKYHAIAYARMADTRVDGGTLVGGKILRVEQGNTVVASNPSLIMNVTATAATGSGYFVAYAEGTTRPSPYSTLNFQTGLTMANLSLTPTGADGTVDIYNTSSGVQGVVDCLGYFAAT